ncbi:MAG: rhomboid family intramembrane serine protease [Pirellulales bacterium]|nr:rhomboid family intramembrane serine protease [Pirellulales bacterium]
MFIPYSCDAPLYYRPFGTIGLIIVNTVVFFAHHLGALPVEPWVLEYGTGCHPQEWLLCNFAHADLGHLLGNMLFLWVFGLIVEGKLGAAKFLSCYLAIGLLHAAIEQTLMLGYGGSTEGSLGASAAIFGIMAMACVWAPANEVSIFVWIFWVVHFTFEMSVGVLAAIYVGWEVVLVGLHFALGGAAVATSGEAFATSSWLHLLGVLIGAPLAIVMLKRGVVDCEGWDLFSVLSGDTGADAQAKRAAKPILEETLAVRREEKLQEGLRRFEAYLAIGQASQAQGVRRRMSDMGMPLSLTARQHAALVVGLHKEGKWVESAPVMAEYLAEHRDNADLVRIKLAQICVLQLERPRKALELLKQVDQSGLSDGQRELFRKVAVAAKQRVEAGEIEIDDAAW